MMWRTWMKHVGSLIFALTAIVVLLAAGAVQAVPVIKPSPPQPKFSTEVAFDKTPALRDMAKQPRQAVPPRALPPERGPVVTDDGHVKDAVLQAAANQAPVAQLAEPLLSFEGLSNQDNFNLFGFRVNPPDPVGDVGPNHYVEMVNLAFAVYDKQGNRLLGPVDTGTLWAGFPVEDCTDASGDPIVLYDQLADRWLLSQFTTRFTADPFNDVFYNCIAISQTGDPTGAYYRYAFTSGNYFPDYPKYGVWNNMYVLTTRDFGPTPADYGISVYGLERNKMINGESKSRAVQFFLDSKVIPISLIGDGLLPPDIDGTRRPRDDAPAPVVGTQDNGHRYGGTFDALNIYELSVKWRSTPIASLELTTQIPVAEFDSIFPCGGDGGNSRDCLPQPGVGPRQKLDILSYRQRPTFRLAYRNFGAYETMVTSQSVEARPGIAGMRWYEIRRADGQYTVHQQGTYAPDDGIHRWMGSIAMDKQGNIGLGYSVVNAVDVYPGIRYTGRLSGDPAGEMTLGEGVVVNGTGVQLSLLSRWGDYTSMNIDPTDDCTFWYVNEYYTAEGQASSPAGWQTRIASFKLPGCQ